MSSAETNIERLLKARAEIDEQLRRHKARFTVVFTDVAGSTAYFDRYGDTAGLTMLHRVADLTATVFGEFRGRVIKTIGDSVMAEFLEPRLAVRAAVELQRRLGALNPTLPARDRVQIRIGVNSGVGFREAGDLYGDVVNLAARIVRPLVLSGDSLVLSGEMGGYRAEAAPSLCRWCSASLDSSRGIERSDCRIRLVFRRAQNAARRHAGRTRPGAPADYTAIAGNIRLVCTGGRVPRPG